MSGSSTVPGPSRIFQHSLAAAFKSYMKQPIGKVDEKQRIVQKMHPVEKTPYTHDNIHVDQVMTPNLKNVGRFPAGVRNSTPDKPATGPSRGRGRGVKPEDFRHAKTTEFTDAENKIITEGFKRIRRGWISPVRRPTRGRRRRAEVSDNEIKSEITTHIQNVKQEQFSLDGTEDSKKQEKSTENSRQSKLAEDDSDDFIDPPPRVLNWAEATEEIGDVWYSY